MPVDSFRYRDYMDTTMRFGEAWEKVHGYVISKDPEVVSGEELDVHGKICSELQRYGTSRDIADCMARGFRFLRLYALAGVVSQLALARCDKTDVGVISLQEYFDAKREAVRMMKEYKESPMLLFEEGANKLFHDIQMEAAETALRYKQRESGFVW